ncbi:DNA phosphorothioation-dependent restriction protein DptH [Paenibacillus hexagrammi]|uniref:DNA phosphorothioation-dependent restriction protein DptH n=1 Tax=Paenibacillus hexagrammi TaxID=2908839 RepID=A0ABY3SF84_9BACL|nr:DNA phosphorothioation-dependent restriction protein DptH [Paenibacillus sp. YPD9-1]UJF32662.1 DNA phosphorothioation-dependent restriction protein DptH [Paenibacillus sp. YPD9-1]
MSNQFYSYITDLLLDFFKYSSIKQGDRFYLQVDKDEDVNHLVRRFNDMVGVQPFTYTHEQGTAYSTICFELQNVKLVIANTSNEVNPDFLVTLRNQVGEQQGEWSGAALFSIVSRPLDSISGGSSDLQKDGMPLHPKMFVGKLKQEIEQKINSKVDQIILNERMVQIMSELSFQQVTFFDFEEIFSAISKGGIEKNDYPDFGLFYDSDLSSYKGTQIKNRLDLNRELFDFVQKYHDLNYEEEILEKKISLKHLKDLKEPELWKITDFTDVKKGLQAAEEESKNSKVELAELKTGNNLLFWNRPQKDSTAGNRKRQIIVFNPDNLEEVSLIANFDLGGKIKSLNDNFVSVDKKTKTFVTTRSGKVNLTININTIPNEPLFTRVNYKHDNKVALGCELFIAVLPMSPEDFKDFETNFSVDPARGSIITNMESDYKKIGDGSFSEEIVEVNEMNQVIHINKEKAYKLQLQSDSYNDENEMDVKLVYGNSNVTVPITFRNEFPETVPIHSFRVWKLKREEERSFQRVQNSSKLIFGNREFYANHEYCTYLDWEQEWVEQGLLSARIDSDILIPNEIKISVELREAYNRFVNRFRIINNIPSLTFYDESIYHWAVEYIKAYVNEIESFTNGVAAGRKGTDLFKLGVLYTLDEILFSPFHPINVAYQLELINSLGAEHIENAVLSRLRPESLVPFIYVNTGVDRLYKSDVQAIATEWMAYKPVQKVSVTDANKYLSNIVKDKLQQFEEHFAYLFNSKNKSPVKINVISIENDLEVVRGILSWMIDQLNKKSRKEIKPIEVTIYRDNNFISAFDLLSKAHDTEEFNRLFNLKIDNVEDINSIDVLRMIHRSVVFYKKELSNEFEYAHISYYRMNMQEKFAIQPMKDMTTGIALKGLYSSVPSMKGSENFRSGFGMRNIEETHQELLIKVATSVNELAANLKNEGNDSYHKGEAIYSRTTAAEEVYLNEIFSASHWVTFIDSNLDLEYFNNLSENLVVIHYNDQYSSSNKYDAITVTNKSEQYFAVIKEFLKSKEVESTDATAINTIKAFNTFNGEWLLRIVGSKGHYSREKLSILSAIKFALAYFDHPNIKWVPISLEEILRVAGSVSLNKSEGIFTTKNLGFKGSHSDDLLLMGIEEREEKLLVHIFPIEVKIGVNSKPVMDKAKIQVTKTKKLFREALCNKEKPFTSKFYRYFFAQLYLVNAAKLHSSGFWPQKDYRISDSIISKLISNKMVISFKTDRLLGDGAVLSFQTNAHIRESELSEGVTYVNLPESDGYNGLTKSMNEMYEWIQTKPNDFVKESMLSYSYHADGECDIDCLEGVNTIALNKALIASEPPEQREVLTDASSKYLVNEYYFEELKGKGKQNECPKNDQTLLVKDDLNLLVEPKSLIVTEEQASLDEFNGQHGNNEKSNGETDITQVMTNNGASIEKIRVLIGKAENSNRDIYWEYGNIGLANRHLLISGKSGQGKTYFMQCLLLELAKQQVSSIVVDYTEGFLPNQLEPEFVDHLGSKLKQRIVYTDKFPINPFRRNVRDIGGLTLPESDTDVAERVKSVFSSVYRTLGIQQQNVIYDAVLRGMQTYDREMNLDHLRHLLEEEGSNYAKTALSQIRPFIDRQVFSKDTLMNWGDILSDRGTVYIIQLTGYPREIQLMITEFILWDLWNFTLRFGEKTTPIPVILDEAQNLDHTEQSPSSKILTEGRKFGWSGWYATQFLKSQLSSDELARLQNASQKIYFAQPEQELSYIASNLSSDSAERKRYETKISSLRKGQCLVHGPILTDSGELTGQTVTTVNITPLKERI